MKCFRYITIVLLSLAIGASVWAGGGVGNVNADLLPAAKRGDVSLVESMLSQGADANAKDSRDVTALMWAVESGERKAVEILLSGGADVNAGDKTGGTALMRAARDGYMDIARLLLDKNADVNAKDLNGYNALVWAAMQENNEEIIDLLKKHGSEIHYCGKCGKIAVGYCKEKEEWVCKEHKSYSLGGKTFICY
jgi:ankyrin repeat protein